MPGRRQRRPVVELGVLGAVRRRKDHAGRHLAHGHRRRRIGRPRQRRADARHDLIGHASLAQRRQLFAGPPEHHRVAALQPRHALALPHQPHQQGIDLRLRERVVALLLANRNPRRVAPAHLDHRGGHQLVMHDHIGRLQQPLRPQRQQILGTRPCPDQPHRSGTVHRRHAPRSSRLGIGLASPATSSS